MMRKLIACLLVTVCPLVADEVVVQLSTQAQLVPIYMTQVQRQDNQMEVGYLRQLGEVLQYDLSHNGMTRLLPPNEERRKLEEGVQGQQFNAAAWKAQNANYVVAPYVNQKAVGAVVYATSGGPAHRIGPYPLSGNLNEDRRKVHQLHDSMHKVLFGSPGIADTRFLYSVRLKGQTMTAPIAASWWQIATCWSLPATYLPALAIGLAASSMSPISPVSPRSMPAS
jgi:Tol biopolymer transport system component